MASLEMELDSVEENLSDDILNLSTADIQARTRLLDNEVDCSINNLLVFMVASKLIYCNDDLLFRL